MSLEIRPLAVIPPPLPPLPIKKMCCIVLLSVVAGGSILIAHTYDICAPFYFISLRKICEGGGITLRGV